MGAFEILVSRDGKAVQYSKSGNMVFVPFMDHLLAALFTGGAAAAGTSGIGLIDSAGFTGISTTDTAASHPGWSEVLEVYDYDAGATQRVTTLWSNGDPDVDSRNNERAETVTAQVPGSNPGPIAGVGRPVSIKGIFLSTVNVIGSTSGILMAATELTPPISVMPGDYLYLAYEIAWTTTEIDYSHVGHGLPL